MVLATNWRATHGLISLCYNTRVYVFAFHFVFDQIIGLPLAFQGSVTGKHHFSSWCQGESIMFKIFLYCQEKLVQCGKEILALY